MAVLSGWTHPKRSVAKFCSFGRAEQPPVIFLSLNREKNVTHKCPTYSNLTLLRSDNTRTSISVFSNHKNLDSCVLYRHKNHDSCGLRIQKDSLLSKSMVCLGAAPSWGFVFSKRGPLFLKAWFACARLPPGVLFSGKKVLYL